MSVDRAHGASEGVAVYFGGIDPGLTGAVAILDQDGALQALYDTPTLTLRTSRGTKQEYDLPGLVGLLAPYAGGGQVHVTLEESQGCSAGNPRPRC